MTHSQLVPTMFVRMLKLDETSHRYDLSTLEVAIHAAAPCPVPVKQQMIEWWGPILYEYYAGTEGIGSTFINSEEWLEHRARSASVSPGTLHVSTTKATICPPGETGQRLLRAAQRVRILQRPREDRRGQLAGGRDHRSATSAMSTTMATCS